MTEIMFAIKEVKIPKALMKRPLVFRASI